MTDDDARARANERFSEVYAELRARAAALLGNERPDHTLQPTALVHEAYLKLGSYEALPESRTHFMAIAANAMRQVLVDHARARGAIKRGGDWVRVPFTDAVPGTAVTLDECVALDDALHRLAQVDPRAARIVELRFFAGLTLEEIAAELELTVRWVSHEWKHAQAWLNREFTGGPPSGS